MALIAFPFIVCLILSPFIVIGICVYLHVSKKREEKSMELLDRRIKARNWASDQYMKAFDKGHIMSDEEFAEVQEEAKRKFGVESLGYY